MMIDHYLHLLSISILLTAFLLVAGKRINSYIKTFRLQSFLLALAAGVLGFAPGTGHSRWEILIVAVLTVVIKVWYIPRLLGTTVQKVEYKVEKDFFLNIPTGILFCCGLVILSFAVVSKVEAIADIDMRIFLADSLAVVLIGLFFMTTRKKAVGQIIGFLVIENGLFTAALLSTHGMPMIVELGIFFDLLTAVLIMGILVFRINENFESINIEELKNLRG